MWELNPRRHHTIYTCANRCNIAGWSCARLLQKAYVWVELSKEVSGYCSGCIRISVMSMCRPFQVFDGYRKFNES